MSNNAVSLYDPMKIIGGYAPKPTDTKVGTAESNEIPSGSEDSPARIPQEDHPLAGQRDDRETLFDPEKHNGAKHPKYGTWMPKRRKKGESIAPAREFAGFRIPEPIKQVEPQSEATQEPQKERPAFLRTAGESLTVLWCNLNSVLHGADAAPRSQLEQKMLEQAFQDTVDAYGPDLSNMPPIVQLAIVLGNYELIRLLAPKEPTTREKVKAFFAVVKHRAGLLMARVFGGKKEKTETEEEGKDDGK